MVEGSLYNEAFAITHNSWRTGNHCSSRQKFVSSQTEGKFVSFYIYAKIIDIHLQNNRGRRTHQEIWVLGLVDTSFSLALGYMEVVQRRDAATLLPIINAHVAPGTVVHR